MTHLHPIASEDLSKHHHFLENHVLHHDAHDMHAHAHAHLLHPQGQTTHMLALTDKHHHETHSQELLEYEFDEIDDDLELPPFDPVLPQLLSLKRNASEMLTGQEKRARIGTVGFVLFCVCVACFHFCFAL